jgi:hypothetical protein
MCLTHCNAVINKLIDDSDQKSALQRVIKSKIEKKAFL